MLSERCLMAKLFQKPHSAEYLLLMLIRKEIMSKLDDLKADVADYHAKVSAKLAEVSAQVEALKSQPSGVSDADLQSVIDMIDSAKAELAPAPAPAPEPAPVDSTPATPTA